MILENLQHLAKAGSLVPSRSPMIEPTASSALTPRSVVVASVIALAFGLCVFCSPNYGQTMTIFDTESSVVAQASTRRAYPKLIHYNRLDKGGHFAAWEQPELFVGELRAAFKSLR